MDAIMPGLWSDSEPINLIRDALNRGEIAHIRRAGKMFAPLPKKSPRVSVLGVTVWQSLPASAEGR